MRKSLIFVFLVLSSVLTFNARASGAGPWRGMVIDAETKEPIEGAVVLALWERVYRTPTGGNSYFYEAKEVLTDKNGRFEIPRYTPINIIPIISYIEGPQFTMFKPGYGDFESHRVYPPMRLDLTALREFFLKETGTKGTVAWDYEKEEVIFGVVELPKLKTREERIKKLPSLPMYEESFAKTKNYLRLLNIERTELGLPKEGMER